MKVIRLNTRLKEILEIELPVIVLFEHLTIRSFIQYLNRQETGNKDAEEAAIKDMADTIKIFDNTINIFNNTSLE